MRLAAVALALGCNTHLNPDYCADHPSECADAASGIRTDADCDSGAALPDGTCALEADVLYASADGTGDCSRASPCSLADGIAALGAKRQLHLAAGDYPDGITLPALGRHYQVFGPATLHGAVSTATNADVELGFVAITGVTGNALACVNATVSAIAVSIHDNTGIGVLAAPCTQLTLSRSTIAKNGGGGLFVNQGRLDVANNLIVQNTGDAGVTLQNGTGRFSLNTVAYNHQGANATIAAGVACAGNTTAVLSGNLITANDSAGAFRTQTSGAPCDFSTSYTVPGSAANDLGFNAIDGSLGSFRLTVASAPVIDVAGLVCSGLDIDGDTRPQGSGCDDGADELSR